MRIFLIGASKRRLIRFFRICCFYGTLAAVFLALVLLVFSGISMCLPVLMIALGLKSTAYLLAGAEKFLRKD
jgi:hypothetical protein